MTIASALALPNPALPTSPAATTRPPAPDHQFSTFAVSSHLHAPSIRLVYLPLSIDVEIRAIPGLPDAGVRRRWWVGHGTSAGDVVEGLVECLGVRKVIIGGKGGRLEFSLLVGAESEGESGEELERSRSWRGR